MEIHSLKDVESTQTYLLEKLRSKELYAPVCVTSLRQSKAKGSRFNSWTSLEGNLFFSFAVSKECLPEDIKLESLSIYFAYILKLELQKLGSDVWIKWPNDFYIERKKIGGLITNISSEFIVCGIGLNCVSAPEGATCLDITINKKELLESYFESLSQKPTWKQIFSKFKIEFELSREFNSHNKDELIILREATLLDDASLLYKDKKVVSLR